MAAPKQTTQKMVPKNRSEAALWLLATNEFRYWCGLNGYKWAKHHMVLGQHLEKVAKGEITRLAVFMPPGSAKSIYTSDLFVAWYMAQNPKHFVIAASHTQELADRFGRQARNRVAEFGPCIGLDLSPDSQAASRWSTVQGHEYFGVGVGGSVTGRRGDLAILDDLVAGAEAADSKLQRDRLWDWVNFDLMTRLKPGARMVLIMTRWHEDDVAGRLLDPTSEFYKEDEAKLWTVIKFPMEAESDDPLGRKPGDLLWPEYFTPEMATAAKRNPRLWTALYQQRPSPEEGGFFKKDWLIPYQPSELPNDLRIYFASDHAVSTKQTADKSCLVVAGVCSQGYIWILPETMWGRYSSEEFTEKALDLVKLKKPLTWWAERGHISQSIGPFLRKRMRERCIYTNIEEVTPTKDKQTRAQAVHGRMSMGLVRVPKFAPWWADAEHELLSFPTGAHDDFVDAIAHLGMGLETMVGPGGPARRRDPGPRPFTGAWLNAIDDRLKFRTMLEKATAGW